MTNRSVFTQSLRAQIVCGLLLAFATAGLTSCHSDNYLAYKFPEYTFANRPVPPSLLANRVMISVSANGISTGSLQIVDAKRDLRSNIQNTKTSFSVSGYASGFPNLILNFPAEITGYVYSSAQGDIQIVNYGKESVAGSAGSFPAKSTGLAVPPTFGHVYSAEETIGQLGIIDNTTGRSYGLVLPNVFQVVVNQGDTVVLAMVRNSNTVYRVVKLNDNNQYPTSTAAAAAIGAADCEPFNLPVYCVVPVNTGSNANAFDRPVGAYFSLDGTTAYVFNCGQECGGNTSSVTYLQPGVLDYNNIPTTVPDASAFTTQVLVPGGVTAAVSDGVTLYVSGQQLQPDGLFAGQPLDHQPRDQHRHRPILHLRRQSLQDALRRQQHALDRLSVLRHRRTRSPGIARRHHPGSELQLPHPLRPRRSDCVSIVPFVTQGSATAVVQYPNTNQNQYYYGDLTGLCWVQGFNKVYTAYGGQVHIFSTVDGSEIDNKNVTVQGTALDVAYMDAITDAAN